MKHKNSLINLSFVADAIEKISVSALRHANRSLRRHPDAKIDRLAANISRFGFIVPIVISEHDKILAGEARVAKAIRSRAFKIRFGSIHAPSIGL